MDGECKVLLVDEDVTSIRRLEQCMRELHVRYFATTDSLETMKLVVAEHPDIVVAGLPSQKNNGQAILRRVKEFDDSIVVIVLATAGAAARNPANLARDAGAFECIAKPLSRVKLRSTLQKAIAEVEKRKHGMGLEGRMAQLNSFDDMVGRSPVMLELFERILKISRSDGNVFIYGESGTGKELLARSIHQRSHRSDHPFIPVDCVALPESLLESELFGFEKGAFTGAEYTRRGLLEYADRGSLFLDEICELAPNLQAKLLRVLQQQEFRRIGGKELIQVNVRIIAASNSNPEEAVRNKLLREDLYYRLNVIPFALPPLRERTEDIPLLLDHYVTRYDRSVHQHRKVFDREAIEALTRYAWPGNIRELQNVVERLVYLVDQERVALSDLPTYIRTEVTTVTPLNGALLDVPFAEGKRRVTHDFEKEYFTRLLKKHQGNISRASHEAGISRRTLYRMIKIYDLQALC